jgi:hypothetical protein
MESVFEIIAEPNRRAILSLLVSSHQPALNSLRQPHSAVNSVPVATRRRPGGVTLGGGHRRALLA